MYKSYMLFDRMFYLKLSNIMPIYTYNVTKSIIKI